VAKCGCTFSINQISHLEGGSYFGGVRGLWQLIMSMIMTKGESKEKQGAD
jgi:hypothetical protein